MTILTGMRNPAKKPVAGLIAGFPAFLFDLFQTLTGWDIALPGKPREHEILGISREEWERALYELSPERLTGRLAGPRAIIEKAARSINPVIDDGRIDRATGARMEMFRHALMDIPPETVDVLEYLKRLNKKIGLASNADVLEIAAWRESPIARFFDSVVFSCHIGHMKPEKEIYLAGARQLDEPPEHIMYVGDGRSRELEGAKSVGLTTVLITGTESGESNDDIAARSRCADYIVSSIHELIR